MGIIQNILSNSLVWILVYTFLFGYHHTPVFDNLVGRILKIHTANENHSSILSTNSFEEFDTKLLSIKFDADMETAIKRKSGTIGQLYDYIKLKPLLSHVKFEVYDRKLNTSDTNSTQFYAINVSFEKVHSQVTEEELNNSQNIKYDEFLILLSNNSTTFTRSNTKFEVKNNEEICSIIINNEEYSAKIGTVLFLSWLKILF